MGSNPPYEPAAPFPSTQSPCLTNALRAGPSEYCPRGTRGQDSGPIVLQTDLLLMVQFDCRNGGRLA